MYSLDFRTHVLRIVKEEGLSIRKLATRFGIGSRTIVRWKNRLSPKTRRNKPATKIDMAALKKDVEDSPDAYLYERAKRLGVSSSGIYSALKRLGVTYKKKRSIIPSPVQKSDLPSAKKLTLMKNKTERLSTLMRVALLMTCLEIMDMPVEERGVMGLKTGELRVEQML